MVDSDKWDTLIFRSLTIIASFSYIEMVLPAQFMCRAVEQI